uniref:AP2/ERF domain-containing protein n=1 Tax=Mucochytrium quahogii TaxID=96639 RepID=A0A7S2SHT7_9STRA|mmetsp:Transcript_15653/g.27292  ORF Transcript_15653/g.27292 Transcript_15653/m.27292 type:complete len:598 (+) Transcript_15653:1180-2973(+)
MERKYTGVAFNKKEQKWRARYCRNDGKRVWVKALFDSEKDAAHGYDKAVLKDGLVGQPLNFATREMKKEHTEKVRAARSIAGLQGETKALKEKTKDKSKKKRTKKNKVRAQPPTDPRRQARIREEELEHGLLQKVVKLIDICYEHQGYDRYFTPLRNEFATESKSWCETSRNTDQQHKLYGIDCEMVLCKTIGGPVNEQAESTLARVSLVEYAQGEADEEGDFIVLMDEYVTVPEDKEVVDYLTDVSGVTEENLEEATQSIEDIRLALTNIIHEGDILIGHSLWSDFRALRLWHENFVDTSSLCGVKDLNLTLSLKDAVSATIKDKEKIELFQQTGTSHDSVEDAKWSIRVMLELLKLQQKDGISIPLLFEDVPDRYKSRITFHLLPDGCSETTVEDLVRTSLGKDAKESDAYVIKPIKWSQRKDGSTTGSCIIEFKTPQLAKRVFGNVPVEQKRCGGYSNGGACHTAGFPDRQSMMRKLVQVQHVQPGGPGEKRKLVDGTCEIICYFPVKLTCKKTIQVKSAVMGRVLGKLGRSILMVQQRSGALVVVTRQPNPTSSTKHLRLTGDVEVSADNNEKVKLAVQLLYQLMKNELRLSN